MRRPWPARRCCAVGGGGKNPKGKVFLGDIGIDGRIILKLVFMKQYVRESTRSVWLRIRWQFLVNFWRTSITWGKYLGVC
jgi:hypothetical protein